MVVFWLIITAISLIEIFSKPQKHKVLSVVLSGLLGLAQGIFRATGAEKDYKEKIRH